MIAVRAAVTGGRCRVRPRRPGVEPGRRHVRIEIADNGIGFDDKYREQIFEPFQRLHGPDEYEGTGIGLAICRKIVQRHGGTITATGRPGEGATFVFTLPLRSLTDRVRSMDRDIRRRPAFWSPRITTTTSSSCTEVFSRAGIARRPALRQRRRADARLPLPPRPASPGPRGRPRRRLVLLDLNMPRLDGRKAAAHPACRRGLRHLPVIALSTSESPKHIAEAYAIGINAYMVKPAAIPDYVAKVRRCGSSGCRRHRFRRFRPADVWPGPRATVVACGAASQNE